MVSLPRLEDYSPEQISQARTLSSALARYLNLIQQPEIPAYYKKRHLAWISCVLATYFKTASTADICCYWSDVADQLIDDLWQAHGLDQLPVALFALGKHGAQELNLSSDIDLLVVGEPSEAAQIEKSLRKFQAALQTVGDWGFCFRLDFDLRPGGKVGPLVTSASQFQDHYWSQGETWERLALVRLRALQGPSELKQTIADLAKRFSFRKFLDFTLLEDLKVLRSQVHQKGFQRMDDELHLKLEVGGIRDIELFIHSLQILNGGKIPQVQTHSTSQAIELLQQHRLLAPETAQHLHQTYWHFRHCENIIQSLDDRQTHSVKKNISHPQLPKFEELTKEMTAIDAIVSDLLGHVDFTVETLPKGEAAQQQWLKDLGFSDQSIATTWPQLIGATALSQNNDRDESARQQVLFLFLNELSQKPSEDRDLAMQILLDFIRATRGKATFFSMLLHTPRLIQDLARLFGTSPYLGSILASRPELLDHFILELDGEWAENPEAMLEQMSERKLLSEIRAANQYISDGSLNNLFQTTTDTADAICAQLLKQLKKEYPEARLEIVALGKWGGQEMGLRSDLDFIFISSSKPNEHDFKVARRFISRLTDPLKSGRLYDIDLRLRPSGQSGPLLVSLDQLEEYWRSAAQAWERQAYLRSRSLSALPLKTDLLVGRGLSSDELAEIKHIRTKLLKPLKEESIDVKYAPGGLVDIELSTQTAVLQHKLSEPSPSTLGMIDQLEQKHANWKTHATEIKSIYLNLRRYEQSLQLASLHKLTSADLEKPGFLKAAQLMKLTPEKAWSDLKTLLTRSNELLNQLDPSKG